MRNVCVSADMKMYEMLIDMFHKKVQDFGMERMRKEVAFLRKVSQCCQQASQIEKLYR